MLVDCELQSGLEQRPRFSRGAGFQQEFPKENARHHPIRFLSNAELEMWPRFGFSPFSNERLRQAESEELVVGFACDQRLELFDASGQEEVGFSDRRVVPQASSMNTNTPVALSGPPRRTASVMISRRISSGSAA